MKRIFLFISLAFLMQACLFFNKNEEEVIVIEPSKTELVIVNATSDTVKVFLTLGSDTNCVNNVNGVFGIKSNGLQGSFILCPKDTVNYISPDGKSLEGNISFVYPPDNCPDSVCYPLGINIFEFNINNNFPYIQNPQETVDISCVSGVNAAIICKLSDSTWNAGSIMPIMEFRNSYVYNNSGLVGVYPIGCDTCTGSKKPPVCPNPLKVGKQQEKSICNVQRNASLCGGKVIVIFNGVMNGIPCE